ncbi:hypothetical protein JR316_0009393 [Psilocybe cubensis]|uniref:Uncharacterized protein n=2 Tax=Psilocybe cubensis TaxID=181762 RepID=A0A8H7XWV7_PSICU|nr:hypothetical protein JR316_0009393 [Psilocybe cubensis]KAH9478930.1 hypothetical protein JR316_0009393 [Psilocybe cubensis]
MSDSEKNKPESGKHDEENADARVSITPSEVEAQYQPQHILSKVSKDLGKDIFFWTPKSMHLMGGLNHNVTPINSRILHLWATLLDFRKERRVKFEVFPVTVKRIPTGIFHHERYRSGENIPEMSTDTLPPGDYDFHVFGEKKIHPFYPTFNIPSFKRVKYLTTLPKEEAVLIYTVRPEEVFMFDVPDDVQKHVLQRDHGQCVVTGVSGDDVVSVVWAVPPPLIYAMKYVEGGRTYSAMGELYKSINAITLRKDLADAFLDGAFGIDVDDDYRVVVLRNFGPEAQSLIGTNIQAYFRQPGAKDRFEGPMDIFLRAHFANCLFVNFQGGDIVDQYPMHVVGERCNRLGLSLGESRISRRSKLWNDELSQILYEHCYGRPFGPHPDNSDSEFQYESDLDEEGWQ